MTNYLLKPLTTLPSLAWQERKAARRKVIEKARQLERDSYKAMMQRKRRLHAAYHLVEWCSLSYETR